MAMMDSRGTVVHAVRSAAPRLAATAHAEVLSVHRSAVNIALGADLLTIAGVAAGGLPGGILVPDGFDPAALGVRTGFPVEVGLEAVELGNAVSIDLTGAAPWSARLRPIAPLPRDLTERSSLVRDAMAAAGLGGLIGWPGGHGPSAWFRQAVATGELEAVGRTGEAIVGLGAGLTPAGDDVLVGFSAALAAAGHPWARPLARRWARHAADRTTPVAHAYHRHAARGDYAERLHVVLRAILAGPRGGIAGAVDGAVAFGATSGVDSLTGATLALQLANDARNGLVA
jgi:hypothetical protein